MSVNVCPADRVQAPVEVVWELLMDPAGYGAFGRGEWSGWSRKGRRRWAKGCSPDLLFADRGRLLSRLGGRAQQQAIQG